jgi:hypothetical protein
MMSVSEAVGWLLIVGVIYASAAAIVGAGVMLMRARRSSLRVPKAIARVCTIALAFAIWYAIPLLIHARVGRATH